MAALPRWLHQYILYPLAVLSVSANTILIVLVTHNSNKNLGNYRILLCTFAVVDITISLFHASIIPAFLQAEFGFVIFAFNTLYLPEKLGYAFNELYCVLFYEPFILIMFHFFYRLLFVVRQDLIQSHFAKGVSTAIMINAAIALMIFNDAWLIYPEIDEDFFAEVLWKEYAINLSAVPKPNIIPVHYIHAPQYGSGPNWDSILSILNCGALSFSTIVFNIMCSVKIMRAVNSRVMSVTLRRMQLQLLRALVIQFTIPLIFCLLPFSVIVGLPATGVSFGQTGNLMGFLVSAFPVIDPICMIVAYSKFRAILKYSFLKTATRVGPTFVRVNRISSFAFTV